MKAWHHAELQSLLRLLRQSLFLMLPDVLLHQRVHLPFQLFNAAFTGIFQASMTACTKQLGLCTGQLCLARLTQVRHFRGLWNDSKEKSGRLCPARQTEIKAFRGPLGGLRNDSKEKSGMWSEVMGLWACKAAAAACKCDFHRSQKVKRSVGATVLQNFRVCQ